MTNENQIKSNRNSGELSYKITFLLGFLVGLATFALIAFIFTGTALVKERRTIGSLTGVVDEKKEVQKPSTPSESPELKIINQVGTFFEVNKSICKDGGKPIVYMFSTSWCPHCQWSKPAFEAAVKDYVKNGKIVAYNWELDTNDNTLTSEKEKEVPNQDRQVYEEFNPNGSIPTFVFGCKYFRVGTGHERENDLKAEEKEFREIIDKLLSQ